MKQVTTKINAFRGGWGPLKYDNMYGILQNNEYIEDGENAGS